MQNLPTAKNVRGHIFLKFTNGVGSSDWHENCNSIERGE